MPLSRFAAWASCPLSPPSRAGRKRGCTTLVHPPPWLRGRCPPKLPRRWAEGADYKAPSLPVMTRLTTVPPPVMAGPDPAIQLPSHALLSWPANAGHPDEVALPPKRKCYFSYFILVILDYVPYLFSLTERENSWSAVDLPQDHTGKGASLRVPARETG